VLEGIVEAGRVGDGRAVARRVEHALALCHNAAATDSITRLTSIVSQRMLPLPYATTTQTTSSAAPRPIT
jgi:hypothetical protein